MCLCTRCLGRATHLTVLCTLWVQECASWASPPNGVDTFRGVRWLWCVHGLQHEPVSGNRMLLFWLRLGRQWVAIGEAVCNSFTTLQLNTHSVVTPLCTLSLYFARASSPGDEAAHAHDPQDYSNDSTPVIGHNARVLA